MKTFCIIALLLVVVSADENCSTYSPLDGFFAGVCAGNSDVIGIFLAYAAYAAQDVNSTAQVADAFIEACYVSDQIAIDAAVYALNYQYDDSDVAEVLGTAYARGNIGCSVEAFAQVTYNSCMAITLATAAAAAEAEAAGYGAKFVTAVANAQLTY